MLIGFSVDLTSKFWIGDGLTAAAPPPSENDLLRLLGSRSKATFNSWLVWPFVSAGGY